VKTEASVKTIAMLSAAALLPAIAAAQAQTLDMRPNMGTHKGIGMGRQPPALHIAPAPAFRVPPVTHPRRAIVAGSHTTETWSAFQTRRRGR
jgi:hypothetical protein